MKNKETLEEAANNFAKRTKPENEFEQGLCSGKALGFIKGAKWQAERSYSEEEVKELCKKSRDEGYDENTLEQIGANEKIVSFDEWFEQIKKK
jgi:hypothetical protein